VSAPSELSSPVDAPPPAPERDGPAWLDPAVRWAGAAVAVWGGAVLGAFGAFATAYRVGTVLVPVALLFAVFGNAVLIRFAHRVTGRRFLALLPGLVWITLSFVASSRTTEGDLVLYQSNWVATVYLLAGSATVGLMAYRMLIPPR
jgi:hypothetical protein